MARDDPGATEVSDVVALPRAVAAFPWADAAASGPTRTQCVFAVILVGLGVAALLLRFAMAMAALHTVFLTAFALAAIWRALAVGVAKRPRRVVKLEDADLPSYTVIVPLYREAHMAPGLVGALSTLSYPRDRLQVLIVLEEDDQDTLAAIRRLRAADGFQIIVAPPGAPKTKPRACNIALAAASGRWVVVYDAEDRPHPLQLKEAAARFAQGGSDLACLQAPLRIHGGKGFLSRQFALEYAAQFEIILPALARFSAPFPLGGTSNHFRTRVLRSIGGWDAWNVTEDADLGFRLAAGGWRTDLLRTPTWESAPGRLGSWAPQRARWVKGYMQTWGVHMRSPVSGGFRRFSALQMTLGLAILSAFAHGPVMLLLAFDVVLALLRGRTAFLSAPDFALLAGGWGAAILAMSAGAKRAELRMRLGDAAAAPIYWALQSWAAGLALVQLCTRPHHWDKTDHRPPIDNRIGAGLDAAALDAKGEASVRRAA